MQLNSRLIPLCVGMDFEVFRPKASRIVGDYPSMYLLQIEEEQEYEDDEESEDESDEGDSADDGDVDDDESSDN